MRTRLARILGAGGLLGALAFAPVAEVAAQAPRLDAQRVGAAPSVAFAAVAPVGVRRPPLDAMRIGGEVVVGAYTGIAGFFIGRYAGLFIADALPHESENARDKVAMGAGIAGAALGTTGGVYVIGSIGDQTGSFGATLIGAGAGAVAGWLVYRVFIGSDRLSPSRATSRMRWLEASIEALLPSVGATIGFNSSRRYK